MCHPPHLTLCLSLSRSSSQNTQNALSLQTHLHTLSLHHHDHYFINIYALLTNPMVKWLLFNAYTWNSTHQMCVLCFCVFVGCRKSLLLPYKHAVNGSVYVYEYSVAFSIYGWFSSCDIAWLLQYLFLILSFVFGEYNIYSEYYPENMIQINWLRYKPIWLKCLSSKMLFNLRDTDRVRGGANSFVLPSFL